MKRAAAVGQPAPRRERRPVAAPLVDRFHDRAAERALEVGAHVLRNVRPPNAMTRIGHRVIVPDSRPRGGDYQSQAQSEGPDVVTSPS
jgi:hypothetical protein